MEFMLIVAIGLAVVIVSVGLYLVHIALEMEGESIRKPSRDRKDDITKM